MLKSRQLVQCELAKWPSGKERSIAVLRMEPSELSERYGLVFAETNDDLDYLVEAAVSLSSGRRLMLIRYRRHPNPGTEVQADSKDDPRAARTELLGALGLDEKAAFTWMPEEEP